MLPNQKCTHNNFFNISGRVGLYFSKIETNKKFDSFQRFSPSPPSPGLGSTLY